MNRTRAWAAMLIMLIMLVMIGASGCEQDPRAPLDLDAIDELDGSCVTVIHDSLELGVTLHRYVADGPGLVGGWGLVTIFDDADQLALVRVPASPDEPATEPITIPDGLGPPDIAARRVEFRAGAVPGELWMILDHPDGSAEVRKIVPEFGVVASNDSLANFPGLVGDGGCPNDFRRQLIMIESRPYVLALPDCSDSGRLDLQLLELDPDSAEFRTTWLLSFDSSLSDPDCVFGTSCTLGSIGPGESTHVAHAERVAVGFTQVREFGSGVRSSDVSLLDLRLTASGPTARLVTFRQVWLGASNLGAVDLGQDAFAVQLHVRNDINQQDAALLRFDTIGELFVQVKTSLPFDGPGRMVQLDDQAAMLHVANGELLAVPLIDVESWPNWRPRTLVELDDLVSIEPAGVGQLLLRRDQAPPQVVHLRCLEP